MYKILFILFFLISKSYAQDTTFFYIKNNKDKLIRDYRVKFNFYQKGDSLTYYSNEKAEIYLPFQLYKKADSIKATYSFYEIKLTKENFANNTIYLNQDLAIDEVVLKARARKKYFVGPNEKYFLNLSDSHEYRCNCVELLSFKNDSIKKITNIKGIRFAFKNDILFGSSEREIEIILIGFNSFSKIPRNNLLLKERFIYKIPKKIGRWTEVDLRGKIKENLPDYKYIAFGFKVIDWYTTIRTVKKNKYPNFYELETGPEGLYILDQYVLKFPVMQIIYEQ